MADKNRQLTVEIWEAGNRIAVEKITIPEEFTFCNSACLSLYNEGSSIIQANVGHISIGSK